MTKARPGPSTTGAWARVAAAIALAAAAAHGSSGAESRTASVEVKDIAFTPPLLTVHVGDTVTWRNRDFVAHTATSESAGFDVELPPGQEGSTKATRAGTFAYLCRYHPNMRGTLVVKP